MNKKDLLDNYFNLNSEDLSFSLYLMDFKASMENNPYIFTRVNFKNEGNLSAYSRLLINNMGNEINNTLNIEEYSGENKEGNLIYLPLNSDMIKPMYEALMDSLSRPNTDGIVKPKGYILMGTSENHPENNILFGILHNPVERRKPEDLVFNLESDGLEIKDEIRYRLLKKCDFILFQGNLYSFNYKFEKYFKLQSTLKRFKMDAIDRIIFKGIVSNSEDFKKQMINYKSVRTFLGLNEERLEALASREGRVEIAKRFNLELDNEDKLILKDEDDSKNLIKHLCFKIIKDADSEDLYLASGLAKLNLEKEDN